LVVRLPALPPVPAGKLMTFKVLVPEDGTVLLAGVKTKPETAFPAPALVLAYEMAEASVPEAVVKVCWIWPLPDCRTKFWLPAIVNPPEAVKSPAEVIVPEPVVEMFPVVEIVMLEAKSPPTTEEKVGRPEALPWRRVVVVPAKVPINPPDVLVTTPLVERPVSVIEVLAERVVKAPVEAVPEPIGPGAAKVAPFKEEAFKLATLVVDATTNGAVPVARVEVNWPERPIVVTPEMAPAEVITIDGEFKKFL